MSIIETRTIVNYKTNSTDNIVSNSKFLVKDYQRGYRWESKQIVELLNDIMDFETTAHKEKYCMQPLVVKRIDSFESDNSLNSILENDVVKTDCCDSYYELIDGQQRLTTTLLILSRCDQKILPYSIYYSFFRKIDRYYIDNALKTIDSWFEKVSSPITIDSIKNEIKTKILFDLQFIWYEVDQNANSVEIFKKLNIGKIPLTNAELFKACLLNSDNVSTIEDRIALSEIAIEWDLIEQSLRDDEFWGFLSKEDADKETRIDLLLKLFALREKNNSIAYSDYTIDDPLFPFLIVCEKVKSENIKVSKIWTDEIVFIHDLLKSWFNDIELYHYIGFLVQVSKNPFDCIIDLISQTKFMKKSEINEYIKVKIKEQFRGIVIDNLDFSKKAEIRKVLLYFNIHTMINSKTKTKFSFKQYGDMNWNIEHIHSRADEQELNKLTDIDSRKEMLNNLRNQFLFISDEDSANAIDVYIRDTLNENTTVGDFVNYYLSMADLYGGVDIDHIGNFTLLDEETNKSYHNSLYPVKRNVIIERDKGEVFIPVCTKNAFLKMYSKKIVNTLAWTIDDAQDYTNAIKKALVEEAKVCQ